MKRINIKYLVVSLVLILSLTLGAGCSQVPDVETSPPPTPPVTPTATPINPNWTPPVESQAQLLPDFIAVVAKVKPSVVAINAEVITYDIFNRPFTQPGAGSGWIIDEDGLIVTNAHVVERAKSITVTLADGRTFPAETVRTDSLTDLAVIKINANNLPAANIGDSSQLRVGELVAAIGNSLGLGISMKGGWVSRLGVSIPTSLGQTLDDFIETDAAINPGNSGGPLVNMAGEIVGITSAKIAAIGVEGMGYAISINIAIPIIEQLILYGVVIRPYLGVTLFDVNPTLVFRYDLPVDKGAFITYLAPDSPADEAGLEPGDVIVNLNSEQITTAQELIQAIHSCQIGQRVKITFWRGETKNTTYATLTQRPPS